MTPNGRLDGWKAIAAYLGRTPRTVQRWRRRGLPVRSIGDLTGSVYAVRADIDRWVEQRGDGDCPVISQGSMKLRATVHVPRALEPGVYIVSVQVELQQDGKHIVCADIHA